MLEPGFLLTIHKPNNIQQKVTFKPENLNFTLLITEYDSRTGYLTFEH
jgi:hypothetical protein